MQSNNVICSEPVFPEVHPCEPHPSNSRPHSSSQITPYLPAKPARPSHSPSTVLAPCKTAAVANIVPRERLERWATSGPPHIAAKKVSCRHSLCLKSSPRLRPRTHPGGGRGEAADRSEGAGEKGDTWKQKK